MPLFGAKLQYEAAMKYYKGSGQGFTRNRSKAFKLFKEAANAGLVEAMLKLSEMYASGEGCIRNLEEASKWLARAAEKGNAEAQYKAAQNAYRSPYVALEYYEKAANQGHVDAILELGKLCVNTINNYDQAIHWLSQPTLKNNPEAIYYLAKAHIGKEKEALDPYFNCECIDEELDIYNEIIEEYQPSNIVKNLYKKALRLYEQQASFGDWESILKATEMYLHGEGGEIDYEKAFNYLTFLANQPKCDNKGKYNDFYRETAMIKLAKMYELGLGCEQNIEKCNEILRQLHPDIDKEWFKNISL